MAVINETAPSTALPPPRSETGVAGWLLANLFSSWFNTILTIVVGVLVLLALWFGLRWVFWDANWEVIKTLGGLLIIGRYNTEAACPGQDCFWRPQAALLLVTILLGMAWGLAGGGVTKRIALVVGVVLVLLAFLPFSLERMGWDVRILLIANLPAVYLGLALARYTPLGSGRWIVILAWRHFW